MNEQDALAIVESWCRVGQRSPMLDDTWHSRSFRGGWYFWPDGPFSRDIVGFGGLVITDDGDLHVQGSLFSGTWAMARYLTDDGPNRRSESDALTGARDFAEAQGGDLVGKDWVGTRFTGGWMFRDRMQIGVLGAQDTDRAFITVLDDGDVSREPSDWDFDLALVRRAAELEFGPLK